MTGETPQSSESIRSTQLRDTVRTGVREMSRTWWWYLILIAWVWYGMFVLSYRVGQSDRGGCAGGRGLPVRRPRRPKVSWWWTQLLLGIAELVLGVWAVRSWERSLLSS